MNGSSSEQSLNFAIVGCGLIGRKRAAALARIPAAALRTTCDLDAARAADLAKTVPGALSVTDYRTVLSDPAIHAVVVATLNASLAPIARPYLDELAAKTGETIHLAQMDLGQVLYVDKRNAAKPVEMFAQAGKVGPAYCTGVGKAMLAYLPPGALEAALARQSFHRFTPHTLASRAALLEELEAIRKRGHAWDREEHEAGIICCAVPILSRNGRVMGALSVTSTTARTTLDALGSQAPMIKDIAAKIAAEAESWRFPEQV